MLGGSEAIAHVLLHCTIMLISHPEHLRRLRHEFAIHDVNPYQCHHGALLKVPFLVTINAEFFQPGADYYKVALVKETLRQVLPLC